PRTCRRRQPGCWESSPPRSGSPRWCSPLRCSRRAPSSCGRSSSLGSGLSCADRRARHGAWSAVSSSHSCFAPRRPLTGVAISPKSRRSFGAALAGQSGGFAALGALTLLPDAASYGLHNRLFGYYWYVIAVPTASYGVGVALVAIAFLRRWTAARDARALLASAALVAGSPFIRVHIFALLLPAWIACAALSAPLVRRRVLLFASGALVVFAVFVWGFYRAFPDAYALEIFLDVTHNQQQPVAYGDLYRGL